MPVKDTSEPIGGLRPPQRSHRRGSATAGPQEDDISMQAREIIDDVLAPGSECEEDIRQGLRRHVASRPGRPDLALLEHVLAVRRQTISGR